MFQQHLAAVAEAKLMTSRLEQKRGHVEDQKHHAALVSAQSQADQEDAEWLEEQQQLKSIDEWVCQSFEKEEIAAAVQDMYPDLTYMHVPKITLQTQTQSGIHALSHALTALKIPLIEFLRDTSEYGSLTPDISSLRAILELHPGASKRIVLLENGVSGAHGPTRTLLNRLTHFARDKRPCAFVVKIDSQEWLWACFVLHCVGMDSTFSYSVLCDVYDPLLYINHFPSKQVLSTAEELRQLASLHF